MMCDCTALLKQGSLIRRSAMRDQQVSVFSQRLSPILQRELDAARSALDRAFLTRDESDLRRWIEEFYPTQENRIIRDLRPVVRTYGEDVVEAALEEMAAQGTTVNTTQFSELYTRGLASRWTSDSIAQLRQILRDEDDVEEVTRSRLDEWEQNRVGATAASEATQANGAFAKHAFLVAGATELVWRTSGESCPLCRSMDGRVVGIERPFLSPGDVLSVDDDSVGDLSPDKGIGHPPLHGMGGKGGVCDCLVTAA